MKAFLPEAKTSVSKLESVSVTDPAAAEPTTAARPSRTAFRTILESTMTFATNILLPPAVIDVAGT